MLHLVINVTKVTSELKYKTVKIDGETFEKLEKHKEKTGVPMSVFVKKAVEEKFAKLKKAKKP